MEETETRNKLNDVHMQISKPVECNQSKNEEGNNNITTNNQGCNITTQISAKKVYFKETKQSPGPIIYQVPDPVKSFCGREQELEKIDKLFQQNKIVTITGMAGIGKTELAKNYVNNYRKKFQDNLIWINGETEENVKSSFKGLAVNLKITHKNLNLVQMVQMVYSYFINKIVLFVIDNADNRQSIRDFLPSVVAHTDCQIFILITSQNNNWGDIPTVPLNILSQDVALNVFKEILGPRFQTEDEAHWLELAEILNFVPLVLQIAASHVKEEIKSYEHVKETFNVKHYVSKLKKEDHNILVENFPENSENDYTKTIYTAVKISIDKIEKINSKESKIALDILSVSSYLDASSIDCDSFLTMDGVNNSKGTLIKAYSILMNYSLISIRTKVYSNHEEENFINIHRLVQWILRYHQQQRNLTKTYYTMTLDMIPIATGIGQVYSHLQSIFRHGERVVDICANYYFIKKPEHFLNYCVRFGCDSVLKRIFDAYCGLKGKYLIWSKDLLTVAIGTSEISTFDLMLQYYSNVHKRYAGKRSLLHYAADSEDLRKIKRITELGIQGNAVDAKGLTPLHVLCDTRWVWRLKRNEANIIDCGRFLINKAQANVNALDFNGNSPLYYASMCYLLQVSDWLVRECKADVNTVNKYGESVLSYLIATALSIFKNYAKLFDIGRLLIAHGARTDIRIHDKNRNLLHLSIARRSLPLIRWVVEECHIDVNSQDEQGDTALHILASTDCILSSDGEKMINICKFLLDQGTKVDTLNNYSESVLSSLVSTAASKNMDKAQLIDIGRLLIAHGARTDIRVPDKNRNLLHLSVDSRSLPVVRWVVEECRIDVNSQDARGDTALHILASIPCILSIDEEYVITICKFLLEQGAKVDITNIDGLKPIQVINEERSEFLLEYLS